MILTFLLLVGAQSFAASLDPACQFIDTTMIRAREILEVKQQDGRNIQMCELLKQKLGSEHIGNLFLGNFANLSREQVAIEQFKSMVPSIMMTKAIPVLGAGGKTGSFEITPTAKDRGNGVLEVTVTVTSNSKSYVGFAIVKRGPQDYELIDVEYMGYSAVGYQGREYQKFLNREFNKDPHNSMPVSALVQQIEQQDDYVSCPL